MWPNHQKIGREARETDQQKHRGDDKRPPEESVRMLNVRGRVLGSVGETIERPRGFVDRSHQMRGDVHQVHRDPFGRELARRRPIGTRERFFIDARFFIVAARKFAGRADTMESICQCALR
jgi:hypothetical protein